MVSPFGLVTTQKEGGSKSAHRHGETGHEPSELEGVGHALSLSVWDWPEDELRPAAAVSRSPSGTWTRRRRRTAPSHVHVEEDEGREAEQHGPEQEADEQAVYNAFRGSERLVAHSVYGLIRSTTSARRDCGSTSCRT